MAPTPTPAAVAPEIIGLVTAAITGAVTYAVAKVNGRAKRDEVEAEKALDVQEQINKAVAGLIDHYTTALAQEKARHADHVQELEDRIEGLVREVGSLRKALRDGGIIIQDEL